MLCKKKCLSILLLYNLQNIMLSEKYVLTSHHLSDSMHIYTHICVYVLHIHICVYACMYPYWFCDGKISHKINKILGQKEKKKTEFGIETRLPLKHVF